MFPERTRSRAQDGTPGLRRLAIPIPEPDAARRLRFPPAPLHVLLTVLMMTACPSARAETVYSATAGSLFFSPGAANAPLADDLRTVRPCGCMADSYTLRVGGGGDGSATFDAELSLWDGCPGAGGQLIVGSQRLFTALNDAGMHDLLADLSSAPVPVSQRAWVRVQFSTSLAGVVYGAAAETGFSDDLVYLNSSGCAETLPGGFAAFHLQMTCGGGIAPPPAANPDPPDQAGIASLSPRLTWDGPGGKPIDALHARPDDEELPGPSPTDWTTSLVPGQWCGTFERYRAKGRQAPGALAALTCPRDGICDLPAVRDAFIPAPETPVPTVRLRIHVFCDTFGGNCVATEQSVLGQMASLNAQFAAAGVQFSHEGTFVNSSMFRNFTPDEEAAMKFLYADSPTAKLNIYVVDNLDNYSVAVLPWDPDALTAQGGIIMDAPQFAPGNTTLAHEVGHALGLWHTFHGVSEVAACGACYEPAGSTSSETGDRCADTPPAPISLSCASPGTTDPCNGQPWGDVDYSNYMTYAPSPCRNHFTPQQIARMHCWTQLALSGWLEDACAPAYDVRVDTETPPLAVACAQSPEAQCDAGLLDCHQTYHWQVVTTVDGVSTPGPVWSFTTPTGGDCNGNSVPDGCDIAAQTSLDCNANGIPDECELPPLDPQGADCNTNGIPDDCDIANGSFDCQPDGIPDECQVPPLDPQAPDCNANGVPDDCEADCQPNGIPDDCDLAAQTSLDCQPNFIPDECDIAGGGSLDEDFNLIPDECDCPPQEMLRISGLGPCAADADCPAGRRCVAGRCYFPHSRYLALDVSQLDAGAPVAIRLTHVGSGETWWVAGHQNEDPPEVFRLGRAIACVDWAMQPPVIGLGDCAIVPGESYVVQAMHCNCDPQREQSFSPPLTVPASAKPLPKHWGDVVGVLTPNGWTGPNGFANIQDVTASVQAFQGAATAPSKLVVDVHPQRPNRLINVSDILMLVIGSRGDPYAFAAPQDCP